MKKEEIKEEREGLGNIYWDKAAIFHEIQTEPCPEIAKEVQNLLQKEIPLAPYPEGLVPWRTQFPGPKSNLLAYSS